MKYLNQSIQCLNFIMIDNTTNKFLKVIPRTGIQLDQNCQEQNEDNKDICQGNSFTIYLLNKRRREEQGSCWVKYSNSNSKVELDLKLNLQVQSANSIKKQTNKTLRSKCVFKRSSNNSHKKFLSAAKKALFQFLSSKEKKEFKQKFSDYRNSRVYFFIILLWAKNLLQTDMLSAFGKKFIIYVTNKIKEYQKQMENNFLQNFIKFRMEQIQQLNFAIQSMIKFVSGSMEEAVEILYKKNKKLIPKNKQYLQTFECLKIISETYKFTKTNNFVDLKEYLEAIKDMNLANTENIFKEENKNDLIESQSEDLSIKSDHVLN